MYVYDRIDSFCSEKIVCMYRYHRDSELIMQKFHTRECITWVLNWKELHFYKYNNDYNIPMLRSIKYGITEHRAF